MRIDSTTMRTTSPLFAIASALALLTPANAQSPHAGNGFGDAYIESGVATIGGTYDVTWGSPNALNGISVFCSSDAYTPMSFPGVGLVCMDFNSAAFYFDYFALDAQGEASASLPVPNSVSLVGNPPIFGCVAVCENNGFSITKTVRISYENADGYQAVSPMATARALHTVTPLFADARDNESRLLIAGGGGGTILVPLATDSTEIYEPLSRTFVPGPNMSIERTLHRGVRLADGTVLLIGGADSNGNVTDTCEIYDPTTNTISATGAMTAPRAGHAATLLSNGKVLVTGGLADYVDPNNNFVQVMNTAQDTAELYDPASGTWTAVASTMSSTRSGHSQVTLDNGNVLIIGGISGAQLSTLLMLPVPVYTGACDVYDPVANTMTATGSLTSPRGFLGASVLGNGDVLASGGSVSNTFVGTVSATGGCEVWNGSTWSAAVALPTPVTNHVQVRGENGDALIFGGLTGAFPTLAPVAAAGRHDGTTWTPGNDIGTNPGIPAALPQVTGAATAALLQDGTWLLVGGSDAVGPLTTTFVFHE